MGLPLFKPGPRHTVPAQHSLADAIAIARRLEDHQRLLDASALNRGQRLEALIAMTEMSTTLIDPCDRQAAETHAEVCAAGAVVMGLRNELREIGHAMVVVGAETRDGYARYRERMVELSSLQGGLEASLDGLVQLRADSLVVQVELERQGDRTLRVAGAPGVSSLRPLPGLLGIGEGFLFSGVAALEIHPSALEIRDIQRSRGSGELVPLTARTRMLAELEETWVEPPTMPFTLLRRG